MTTELKVSDDAADISDPVHPRDVVCEAAGKELLTWVTEWRQRHDLRPWETAYLINVLYGRHAQEMCIVERGA